MQKKVDVGQQLGEHGSGLYKMSHQRISSKTVLTAPPGEAGRTWRFGPEQSSSTAPVSEVQATGLLLPSRQLGDGRQPDSTRRSTRAVCGVAIQSVELLIQIWCSVPSVRSPRLSVILPFASVRLCVIGCSTATKRPKLLFVLFCPVYPFSISYRRSPMSKP